MAMVQAETMPPISEYHDNFDSARAAMGDALSRDRQASLFNRLDWLEPLYAHALSEHQPLLLRSRWQGAECWLPLMRTQHGQFMGLSHFYNFQFGPIFAGAHGEASKIDLLLSVAAEAAKHARRIDLHQVPDEDKSATLLQSAFVRSGWVCQRYQCDVNHILNVQGRSFEAYWATRPSQLRNTVRRKAKKGAVRLHIERRFNAKIWGDYETVYAQSWKPVEGNPAFLRQLAQQEGAAGCLRMGIAYLNEIPVAAQFWTSENGVALIHKLAHTKDSLPYSPGTLLTHALMREVIDTDHVRIVDFGTGDDAYKPDWMDAVRPRYHLTMLRPLAPANWPWMIKQRLKGLAGQATAD